MDFGALPQQLVNGILIGSIYALIALGYTMVYGVLRLINFAHGEVFMIGCYAALFTSWAMGFTATGMQAAKPPTSNIVTLLIMLFVSMAVCSLVGVTIERFAYRPMRNQSRIASLITAIGVSLLLQFGGQLFLPPLQQNIQAEVNPFRDTISLTLRQAPASLKQEFKTASLAQKAAEERLAELAPPGALTSELSPEALEVRERLSELTIKSNSLRAQVNDASVFVVIQKGKLIMFAAALVLMIILRHIVLKTATGRAMRAVNHDFQSASLMGVNVNRVITYTFMIGSALAGAGAMMNSTFEGTAITPFAGVALGVKAFVAAVLGGIGNIPGAVLGGILMGVAESLVVWVGLSGYKDAIAFVILIVILLFRPGGLLGSSAVEKV
jgi:branched-chain amino acid transport system permease protein